jgi:hypothetical protein
MLLNKLSSGYFCPTGALSAVATFFSFDGKLPLLGLLESKLDKRTAAILRIHRQ